MTEILGTGAPLFNACPSGTLNPKAPEPTCVLVSTGTKLDDKLLFEEPGRGTFRRVNGCGNGRSWMFRAEGPPAGGEIESSGMFTGRAEEEGTEDCSGALLTSECLRFWPWTGGGEFGAGSSC